MTRLISLFATILLALAVANAAPLTLRQAEAEPAPEGSVVVEPEVIAPAASELAISDPFPVGPAPFMPSAEEPAPPMADPPLADPPLADSPTPDMPLADATPADMPEADAGAGVAEPVTIMFPSVKLGEQFNVNCGGDSFDDYTADVYAWLSSGTSSFYSANATVVGTALAPSKVFASHRYGIANAPFTYTLPIETPGAYDCSLFFGETWPQYFAEGGRVFGVSVAGSGDPQTEDGIDMFLETGGDMSKPVIKSFTGIATTDTLTIGVTSASAAEPFISGISCMKVPEVME